MDREVATVLDLVAEELARVRARLDEAESRLGFVESGLALLDDDDTDEEDEDR
jgi:hypothetical protein